VFKSFSESCKRVDVSFKHEYYKIVVAPIEDEDPNKLDEVFWDVIGAKELRFFIY